ALEILSTRNEDPSSENAVHLLVSDWNMGSTEEGEAFLGKVRELPRRPYIALYTGATKIGEEVRGLCDIVIQKSDAALYVEMQGVPHQARQFWKDNEAPEFEPRKPYEASKMSPLPKIDLKNFDPTKDNHHILDTQALPNNWTALLDFDNTLHISESSHGIMLQHFVEFLLNKNQSGYDQTQDGGDHERLEELYAYCQNWERQRDLLSRDMDIKERVIGYEEGLIHSGDLSAIAFKGMKLSKLSGFAGRFVNHFMKGRFPATNERSIKKIREHGIVGVLTTGTPDFLVPHLLPKLDLNFGYGMTYTMRELTDSNGQKDFELTGKVDVNQGLATAKAELGTRLKKSGRPVAFAMGDSIGDSGSASSAIHRSTIKWDVNGSAVIVNATDEAKAEFMRHYQNDRIRVTVPREQTDDRVIADIGVAMRTIFWPLHEYLSLQDNKEALLRFEERFREQGENEDTIRNLENLKRLRDILEREGLAKDQIRAHLERFYPAPLVDSILKSGIINTRNEPDFRGWLLKSVAEAGEDTSDIREAIEVILRGNRMIHQKNGSIQPVTRRPSKVPPPDSTSED
ncbi:MAG: hypothetical protein OEY44_03095, partial [Candidatus Peregrinibacteria bacterium]|nr:hypothetical protein [Candidatus Peregrinibacteria bacterium]